MIPHTAAAPEVIVLPDGKVQRVRRMRRGVVVVARLIEEFLQNLGFRYRAALITLTYRDDVQWDASHIKNLVTHYRKWCQRRGCDFRYVWTVETTLRGRPHYHIVAWLPRGLTPPLPDKQGWWPHGQSNAKWARSPVGYIAKYASKGFDAPLPFGCRIWGAGGLPSVLQHIRRWLLAPGWLKKFVPEGHHIRKLVGGWWRDLTTGIEYRTPWDFDLSMGTLRWRGWGMDDICIKW